MISSSPRSFPMDSGASRCQQASARATARPFVVRYMTIGRFAIVFDSRLRPTSWSHAAAYQALSGKCRNAAWPVGAAGDWVGRDLWVSSGLAATFVRRNRGAPAQVDATWLPGCPASGGDRVLVVGGCFLDH